VDVLLAFGAALVSLRLAVILVRRARTARSADLALWAASLVAFALASAALAWGAANGWDDRTFRAYYLFGGLLSAPLLGAGSLARVGVRWAAPLALAYTGLAVGVAIAEPIGTHVLGAAVPDAQAHFDLVPARLLAIAGNSLGTVAAVVVALYTLRSRPLANTLLLAGIAVAAIGSALTGLGAGESAAALAAASLLLYGAVVYPRERIHRPPTV
jgi:dipeptide/tripeptide permease